MVAVHNYFSKSLLIIEVLCIGFFIALYVTAYAITGDAFKTTLSEMLSENVIIQQLYTLFIGMYTTLTIWLIVLIFWYDFTYVAEDNNTCYGKHKPTFYLIVLYSYVLFAITKLVGFIGLFFYDCNTSPDQHYIFAGIGFTAAVLASWCLFIRRVLIFTHLVDDTKRHAHAQNPHQSFFMLLFNFLFVLTMTALLISFAFVKTGDVELFTGIFIILDPCFIIHDFNNDPIAVSRHQLIQTQVYVNHVYQIPKKQYFCGRIYHKILYYYNTNTLY